MELATEVQEQVQVKNWWKEGVIYQIYPASFKSDGNKSVGDLKGILSKLDYIKSIGVNLIWISPFYQSPQKDLGYDISDYKQVHEPYGNVEDAEAIIKGCHERGMKVVFDLVINHTSDQHAWFKESRSSKTNPKRDWYMWKPATYDSDGVRHPPNNWRSCFGGSVWEWDELTEEYYLHFFLSSQPDCNWENEVCRKALYEEGILFWLNKGLDGFRIDTVNMYSKQLDFPNAPVTDPSTPWQPSFTYFSNGPRLHEFLKEMRAETFAKYDTVAIGELPSTPILADILKVISVDVKELDVVIQFDLHDLDHLGGRFPLLAKKWKLSDFKQITVDSQELTNPEHKAWAITYLENHDQARSITRFGNDSPEFRVVSGKMLATYLLTLSGTIILYQGQEIGMINCPKSWPMEEYRDCWTTSMLGELLASKPELEAEAIAGIQLTSRDHARTPVQWTNGPQAGFSTEKNTWMKVMDSYVDINVEDQDGREGSLLEFYRMILKIRKEMGDLFVYGRFELFEKDNEETMIYTKKSGGKTALIGLNFTSSTQPFNRPAGIVGKESLLFSTTPSNENVVNSLGPYEARVYIFE